MKKLLLTFLLPLIALSSVSHGEELNSLFGISLYDNAEKYVSSNYIDSNKFKNEETITNYYDLFITDKIQTKSPYSSQYRITIDNNNVVHRIYGEQEFINLDICQAVRKDLLSRLEDKYQIIQYNGVVSLDPGNPLWAPCTSSGRLRRALRHICRHWSITVVLMPQHDYLA